MIETLIAAFLAWLQLTGPAPVMVGLATHYGPDSGFHQGDEMRNGQGLDLAAPTVAVNDCRRDRDGVCINDWDIPWWERLANKKLLVYLPN